MAEADRAAQHGGAAELHFAGLEHDRFVERLVLVAVILAAEDAQEDGLARDLHGHRGQIHLMELMLAAKICPAHTETRQRMTDAPILAPARNHSPSFIWLSVCSENEENVV